MITCIVPAHKEEKYIEGTLISLLYAREQCNEEVQIMVVENGDRDGTKAIVDKYGVDYMWTAQKSRTLAKNKGALIAKGETLTFVDADCYVSSNFFSEVATKAKIANGGGIDDVRLPRHSLGIMCFLFIVGLVLLWHRIRVGAFWVKRKTFYDMGGFNHLPLDDIDFAKRLKRFGTSSLEKSWIIWSTRKFDKYGDWYWLRGYK